MAWSSSRASRHYCLPAEELSAQGLRRVDRYQVLAEHGDAIAQAARLVKIVVQRKNGASLPAQGLDEVANRLGGLRIQRAGRFIQEEHGRFVQ